MKFEIINPSDKLFLTAPDLLISAVAICLLSKGVYALKGIGDNDNLEVPLFLFGGHDGWFLENLNCTFQEALIKAKERKQELIDCLKSIEYETERGSMNNIQQCGIDIAKSIYDVSI